MFQKGYAFERVFERHFEKQKLVYISSELWKSDWAESADAAPFDMTFEAADDRERRGKGRCNPATYYFSFVNCLVWRKVACSLYFTH